MGKRRNRVAGNAIGTEYGEPCGLFPKQYGDDGDDASQTEGGAKLAPMKKGCTMLRLQSDA